jgi:uracil-DNA glycosylase
VPMPHPSWRNNAWLKRNPWFQTELLPALRTAGIVASASRSRVRDFEAARD